MFYSYLLKLTEWLMLVISGIEFTTCFKNMPMQRTIPENITAAKAIVKIVIIIINLFKIYYLLFLKHECKVNTFLLNKAIILACGSRLPSNSIVMVVIISLIKKPY